MTFFCEAAAKVLDMFVNAEDLLDDEGHREIVAFVGEGPVGGHFAIGDGDFYLSCRYAVGVGCDCLCTYRLNG